MTPRELAAEALAREALTDPGPWREEDGDVLAPDDLDCPRGYNPQNRVAECYGPANSKFIATAKSDVPALALAVIALSDRVEELEATLKGFLPRCNHCGVFATRRYIHCSGHRMTVCDNDKCMEENFCDECGQVWYGDDPKCDGFNEDGGQCTGTSKHPETHVSHLYDLRYAVVIRSLR